MQYFQYKAEQKIKSAVPRKVEDEAVEALVDYPWPGNVRQLRHVVEKLVVGTLGGSVINADAVRRALDNHPHVGLADGRQPITAYAEGGSLNNFLDRAMLNLYHRVRAKTGSHSQTAHQLRVDRTSLYQRLERARRRFYIEGGQLVPDKWRRKKFC
jgi:transcriptional regulator with PAS, ATPase and Fis domain